MTGCREMRQFPGGECVMKVYRVSLSPKDLNTVITASATKYT